MKYFRLVWNVQNEISGEKRSSKLESEFKYSRSNNPVEIELHFQTLIKRSGLKIFIYIGYFL
jgi:hypothetical protein